MKKIYEIIEEVKSLRGANVSVFGCPTTLPEKIYKYTIDIIDILKTLENYEAPEIIDYWTYEEENGKEIEVLHEITIDEYLELLEEDGYLIAEESNNTYNWSAPVSNDFYYHVYKNLRDDNLIIKFAIHKYGDVRGNYTDEFCIIVDNKEEFYEAVCENDYFNVVEINEKKYYIYISFANIMFEVCEEDDKYIGEICNVEDDKEAIEEIKKLISL